MHHLLEYQSAQDTCRSTAAVPKTVVRRWVVNSPLCCNVIKVDASYDEDRGWFSVGAAVFNRDRKIIAAMCRIIQPPGSVIGAELKAICEGLSWYKGLWNDDVYVLSDSMDALYAAGSSEEFYGPAGSFLADIKELSDASVKGLCYISRKYNLLAHNLARFAHSSSVPQAWFEAGLPFWIEEYARSEEV